MLIELWRVDVSPKKPFGGINLRKKTLWIALVIVAAATVASPAHADTYQYTFDLNPVLAPSTPIIFDTTGPLSLGTDYSVISGSINSISASTFEVNGSDDLLIGGLLFSPLSAFTAITSGNEVLDDTSDFDIGTLSVTDTTPATSAPEPNSLSLLLIGLVALGTLAAVSKRKSLGTSMAS